MCFLCVKSTCLYVSLEQEHTKGNCDGETKTICFVLILYVLKGAQSHKTCRFCSPCLGNFFHTTANIATPSPYKSIENHTKKKEVGKAKFFDTTKASAASMASIERPCNTVPNSLRSPTKTSRHCLSDSSTRLRPRCPRSRASRRGPPYRVLSEK